MNQHKHVIGTLAQISHCAKTGIF